MILLSNQFGAKLHWIVAITVYWLKTIGLAPFSYQLSKSGESSIDTFSLGVFCSSKIGLAYNILLLFLLQVVGVLGFSTAFLFSEGVSFDSITSALEILISYLSTNLIIIHQTFRQRSAVLTMNKLLNAERLLSHLENFPQSGKRMSALFLAHLIFNAFFWITFISFGSTTSVGFLGVYWLLVEYSVVLELLTRELRRVNENLLDLGKISIRSTHRDYANYLSAFPDPPISGKLRCLNVLRGIRVELYEACGEVDDFFSLPILVSVGCYFYLFVKNCSKVFRDITKDWAVTSEVYLSSVSSTLVFVYPITFLSLNVLKVRSEAELTGWIVHKLLASATTGEIKVQLRRFSVMLLQEHVAFTAHDWFPIDGSMLIMILQATMTYVLIFKSYST